MFLLFFRFYKKQLILGPEYSFNTERKRETTLFFTFSIFCGIMNMFYGNCNIDFMGIVYYHPSPYRSRRLP